MTRWTGYLESPPEDYEGVYTVYGPFASGYDGWQCSGCGKGGWTMTLPMAYLRWWWHRSRCRPDPLRALLRALAFDPDESFEGWSLVEVVSAELDTDTPIYGREMMRTLIEAHGDDERLFDLHTPSGSCHGMCTARRALELIILEHGPRAAEGGVPLDSGLTIVDDVPGARRDPAAREKNNPPADNADLLRDIWLYIDWRYVTSQLTTEQKERFANAVESLPFDPDDPDSVASVERWWRDDVPAEDHRQCEGGDGSCSAEATRRYPAEGPGGWYCFEHWKDMHATIDVSDIDTVLVEVPEEPRWAGARCNCGHHINQHNGMTMTEDMTDVVSGPYCVACDCTDFEPAPLRLAGTGPRYLPFRLAASGESFDAIEVMHCTDCGSIVSDTTIHDRFHREAP